MIKKIANALQQAKLKSYQVGDDVTNLINNATFNDETAEATYKPYLRLDTPPCPFAE